MTSREAARTFYLAGTAVAITAGAYYVGERINSATETDVEMAQLNLDAQVAGYLALAETSSCETNVLATFVELPSGYTNPAEDTGKATTVLDAVCGQTVQVDHRSIAERSVPLISEVNVARSHLSRTIENTE